MNDNPLIGVVVPIYNVEKYLKECLDSIINQTYKNLKILLINDGSTDNSLDIAKQYAIKDNRIMIINKQNGGVGSARNAGIDYFCNSYQLQYNSMGGGLHSFNIKNHNPYDIQSIYQAENKDDAKEIDYIIFIDPDDYWELNCIEQCLKYIQNKDHNIDIVWFEHNSIYDGVEAKPTTQLRQVENTILTPIDLINEYSKYKIVFFCATNNIFTKFKLIKDNNICYINNIIYEDVFFGIALVLNKANKIYQTNKKLYNYRVRPNSITTTTNINNINLLSTQTRQEYCKFKTKNLNEAKELFNAACMSITAIKTIEYLNKNPRNKDAIIGQFMRWLCSFIQKYLESKNDPYCLISKFDILKPYISTCHYHTKLAIKYPMQYRLFAKQISKIIQMARFIKRKLKH